jgi:hypothetical protein
MKAKITLDRFLETTRQITVKHEDVAFDVLYRVNAVTFDLLGMKYLYEMLPKLIVDWEIGDSETGETLPVTEEVCKKLPVPLQRALFEACVEDARGPGKDEKN